MSKDTSQITEIEISGVDPMDYPDFSDAYICRAQYKGIEMTDEQLDELQDGSFEQSGKRRTSVIHLLLMMGCR